MTRLLTLLNRERKCKMSTSRLICIFGLSEMVSGLLRLAHLNKGRMRTKKPRPARLVMVINESHRTVTERQVLKAFNSARSRTSKWIPLFVRSVPVMQNSETPFRLSHCGTVTNQPISPLTALTLSSPLHSPQRRKGNGFRFQSILSPKSPTIE